MLVSFRPHTIRRIEDGDGYYDNDGNFIESSESYGAMVECRYEPNGKASTIVLPDGIVATYSYMVYLCTDCPEFEYGDIVELFDQEGKSKGRFKVFGFHRGQLDAKLWV